MLIVRTGGRFDIYFEERRSKQKKDCHGLAFFLVFELIIYLYVSFVVFVFVAMEHVGGNSDLQKLFEMGKLEEMLLILSSRSGATTTTTEL